MKERTVYMAPLDVPIIWQMPELPTGCEVTSLAMALQYKGVRTNKITLANQLPKDKRPVIRNQDGIIRIWGDPNQAFVGNPFGNGYSIFPAPLKQFADQFRPTVDLTGAPFKLLEQQIEKGNPVMVWITINYVTPLPRYWKTPEDKLIKAPTPIHCVVMTGFDQNQVYFNDPLTNEKNMAIDKTHFIQLYHAIGKHALAIE